jgi:hypothetical protein
VRPFRDSRATASSDQDDIGLDLEKMAATPAGTMAFTGLNTKASNDQLRFQFDNVTSDTTNGYLPARQYVFC